MTTTGTPTASFTTTGTLPTWLSFIDNTDGTATLVGTPDSNSSASYTFTITASNGVAPDATQSFTLFVTQVGLLMWETRYVSASLAYPALKPPAGKER